jgi:hypothetical protein
MEPANWACALTRSNQPPPGSWVDAQPLSDTSQAVTPYFFFFKSEACILFLALLLTTQVKVNKSLGASSHQLDYIDLMLRCFDSLNA